LIDTLNNIYIISVSQRTLEKPIEKEQMRLNKMGSSSSIYYDEYNTEGSYNNIIIYRKTTGEKQALFDNRINITRYYDRIINEKVYLFVVGTKGDMDLLH
jgi:hypothetical protein